MFNFCLNFWVHFNLDANVIKTDYRIGRALEEKHIDKAIELLLQTE